MKLLKSKELLLPVLLILFLGILTGYFIWTIQEVTSTVGRAVNVNSQGSQAVEFNLSGAARLDLRGLPPPK